MRDEDAAGRPRPTVPLRVVGAPPGRGPLRTVPLRVVAAAGESPVPPAGASAPHAPPPGSSGAPGPRRPRPRRTAVLGCVAATTALLGLLGAAGLPTPTTAAFALPAADTSAFGATGRVPEAGVAPLPEAPGPAPALPEPDAVGGVSGGSGTGIPETVLAAYRAAEATTARVAPGCSLTWPLLAGIGKVESDHADGGDVTPDGTTRTPILGPELTGTGGNAAIPDTDGGRLDHDAVWDRAVGPTQFIPSSWRTYGADGNGDGTADPDNVYDAALASARYLCAGGSDLADPAGRYAAVFRYNHADSYVRTVLGWADAYAQGTLPVPDGTGSGSSSGSSDDAAPTTLAAARHTLLSTTPRVALPLPAPVPTTSGEAGAPRLAPSPAPVGTPPPVISGGTTIPGATVPGATIPGATVPGASVTGATATSSGTTATGATTTGATTTSSGTSSTPGPTSPATPVTRTPTPASAPPSTPTPPSTAPTAPAPSTTTATPAARCTAALPAVARAFGVAASSLTAVVADGPQAGGSTCTVRRAAGPLVVAVTGPGALPATPATGVSRAAGPHTVLTVPPAAGIPDDRARAALARLAATWS